MQEGELRHKDTLRYLAIIAVALVGLAAVAACLAISLTLISEIPFHHIFP
jgi:hypothetical protein